MDFSSRLRQLRGSMTQGDFAKKCGIPSLQTYANYEKGRIPKLTILQQIAQRNGVSVGWLADGEEEPSPTSLAEPTPGYNTGAQPESAPNWASVFADVAAQSSLDWLLDRIDQLSDAAARGDATAASAVRILAPLIRRRVDDLRNANES